MLVAKVLSVMRKFPAVLLALPLGELSPQVTERASPLSPQRRAFAESGAAAAVFLPDPTCENAMPERPQTLRHCSIKNNNSAEHGQSAAETILNHFDAKRPPGIAARRSLGLLITQPWSRALPQP